MGSQLEESGNVNREEIRNRMQAIEKRHCFCYEISVVTAMFGGGHQPGVVDPKQFIRSTAVRGNLRFWWRATRGAVYSTAEQLREQETKIFGSTSYPSPVTIWVDQPKNVVTASSMTAPKRVPQYVAFPFRNQSKEQTWRYLSSCSFQINIRLKDTCELDVTQLKLELEAALWAWVNFGGMGSRTRRGCGSLYSKDFSPDASINSSAGIEAWFSQCQKAYGLNLLPLDESRDWPTLNRTIQVQSIPVKIYDAWNETIDVYRQFRTFKPNNRRRSNWPEADSIRNITQMAEKNHSVSLTVKQVTGRAFPRAQLGMPINFWFKPPKSLSDGKDPSPTILVPAGKVRLASPLLLKVMAISQQRGFGLIAVLNQPRIQGGELRSDSNHTKNAVPARKQVIHPISQDAIYPVLDYVNHPMKSYGRTTQSAVEAFLNSKGVETWKTKK